MEFLTHRLLSRQLERPLQMATEQALLVSAQPDDLESITQFLCQNPEESRGIPVLHARGTVDLARRLYLAWHGHGCYPTGGMELLGHFAVQDALGDAWESVRQGDWYEACEGARCLLGLDCSEIARDIRSLLDEMEGDSLFVEAAPILAGRAAWPEALERLTNWGRQASADSNGGLVLGIALTGEERALQTFQTVLRDPHWELWGGGTASEWWCWRAARALGLDLSWLCSELRRNPKDEAGWLLLLSWLEQRLAWVVEAVPRLEPPESLESVYQALFALGNTLSSSIPSELTSQFALCERRLADRLALELLRADDRPASLGRRLGATIL